ncbi:MAG: methyltransferase domain-containing protein [Pseudomonadota bacterium]|nr:methyltransferase domain-containing protein [Pseudomonadota bacterium]
MFDKKKIRLNHIKAFNKKHKRVIDFFENISEILIEKVFDNNQDYRGKNILEIASRNDILRNRIYCKGFQSNYFQTCLSERILVKNNKRVVSNLNDIVFKKEFFDFCFSILSLNSSDSIPLILKNIYTMLKNDGVFVSVFPSDESFKEFKNYFIEFFKPEQNYNFNPLFDMQTLGNLCFAAGFKNVIVDKENFQFNITKPEEVWNFIRYVGESNYLLKRKNFIVKKSLFKEFYSRYNEELKEGNLKKNTLSIYYLIGKK